MKTIHKYELEIDSVENYYLPEGAKILSATEQRGKVVLYALVDEDAVPTDLYSIMVVGTGFVLDYDISEYEFLDTINIANGLYMFHVFFKKAFIFEEELF